jgi:RsiW-degrading membrane proteinase PrsW (M82 family)
MPHPPEPQDPYRASGSARVPAGQPGPPGYPAYPGQPVGQPQGQPPAGPQDPVGPYAPPPPQFGGGGPGGPPPAFAPPVRRFDWGRLLRLVGVIAPIVLGAVVIILVVGVDIGPVAFIVGLGVAVLPVPLLAACFIWLDRYDPEPWKYLAFVFGWGAAVATSVALGFNTLAAYLFAKNGLSSAGEAVLGAPFIEETMKALGPVLLVLWLRRKKQPIAIVDGIVYFGMSAVGFAMAENILYLGGVYVSGSASNGVLGGAVSVLVLAVVRIGISGFAHPLFTSMTGLGFGISARSTNGRVRWLAPLAGWIGAMCLHSTWNLLSSLGTQALVVGYLAVMAPIFFGAVGVALWARGREARQVVDMLPPYVRAGWLTPPEVAALASVNRRMAARRWARRVAGQQGARAMAAYQDALTKLGLSRDALVRGFPPADGDFATRERQLLAEMEAARKVFTGRDPAMPPVFWDGVTYHVRFPDGSVRDFPPPPQPVVPIPVTLGIPPGYGYGYGFQPAGWRR